MGKENNGEIMGYRVGDHFLCPGCYERAIKILSVHDLNLPAKPVTKKEIEGFICNQCETIVGDAKVLYIEKKKELEAVREQVHQMESALPHRYVKSESLGDLQDIIENCNCKISFVSSFFIQTPPGKEPEISESDTSGIYLVLDQTKEDLEFVLGKMSEMKKRGLITEKKAS